MMCQLINANVSYFYPNIYNNVCLIGRSQMAIIVSLATVAVCPADVIKGFPINVHFLYHVLC